MEIERQPVPEHTDKSEYGRLVAAVTSAILFEDCGSAEDWRDNMNLGHAAIQAYHRALDMKDTPCDSECRLHGDHAAVQCAGCGYDNKR